MERKNSANVLCTIVMITVAHMVCRAHNNVITYTVGTVHNHEWNGPGFAS